ncbi:MAG: DUF262 domain-containing protein [Pirellulales bacterium]|nr:DUF262 domain-containing protein [Pirellulales bacterium]
MSTFDSTKWQLGDLLKKIVLGNIQLPDFQRGWIWDDEHIRSLLTSIARAFPIGAVMLLQNGGDARFKVRPVEGIESANTSTIDVEHLILDGQQRLTSLTQVLMLDTPVQTRDAKKRDVEKHYYIDIERALDGPQFYDEAIIGLDSDRVLRENFGRDIKLDLQTAEKEYKNFFFPCNQILNSDDWEEGLNAYDPKKFQRYMKFRKLVLSEFRNYDIPVIELKKENKKEAVCLVFEKVNTGGVPLSVFELVTATYAMDGINLRDEWYGSQKAGIEGISQRLGRQRLLSDIEPTDFLQGLSLLHTFERHNADLDAGKTGKHVTGVSSKRESVLALPLAAYNKWKAHLEKGFWNAAKFLRKEAFFTKRDLPYRTQLVPLATVLALLKDRWLEQTIYDQLSHWYWCGVLGELYGGAVESRMANDVQDLMAWVNHGANDLTTVRDANFQPARLDTLRSRNSAAYKGINVLIQRKGAQDIFWKSTIRELDETDWEECKLDIHHIFPKDWCRNHNIPPRSFNSILNKTPISYKANRMIGGKAPTEYLRQLQKHKTVQLDDTGMDKLLKTHLLDPSLLRTDDYEAFIQSRRNLLLAEISKVMGKNTQETPEAVAEDDFDEQDGD